MKTVTYSGEYQEVNVEMKTETGENQEMLIHVPIERLIEEGEVITFDIKPELVSLIDTA